MQFKDDALLSTTAREGWGGQLFILKTSHWYFQEEDINLWLLS